MPDLSQDHTAASPLPQPSNFYYNEKVLMSQHVTFRALLPVYRSCWCQLGSATCPPVPSRWETSRQPLNNESQKC
ncbi:unnamed protein product [Knipowitschia caucasica]|uniref:Uncharacterized protein n=1 Tax=Knipowitschia caucasica TaxID=637954 RepID=A0AAV2J6V7_KNICA